MTVWALWNVYQEANNLPRSINSVREVFGDVSCVFVDGKYPDYPEGPEFSTDATHEIARANGTLLTVADYECEKRTAGLSHIDSVAKDGDWVLVLDADETITEKWGWPEKVGKFDFVRLSDGVEYGRCRLYRWEQGLHFKGRHYDCYRANGELLSSLEDAPSYDLIGAGIHYDESHNPTRMAHKRAYYAILRQRENHPSEAANAV